VARKKTVGWDHPATHPKPKKKNRLEKIKKKGNARKYGTGNIPTESDGNCVKNEGTKDK